MLKIRQGLQSIKYKTAKDWDEIQKEFKNIDFGNSKTLTYINIDLLTYITNHSNNSLKTPMIVVDQMTNFHYIFLHT